jgi:hypothetical protein
MRCVDIPRSTRTFHPRSWMPRTRKRDSSPRRSGNGSTGCIWS